MLSVPRELPALMRAQKLQEKASKVGFDWPDVSGAIDKIDEESAEFKAAVKTATAKMRLRSSAIYFSRQSMQHVS